MTIELLSTKHVSEVHDIFTQVTNKLLENNVIQWNKSYPNLNIINYDISARSLYGMFVQNTLVSVITINTDYEICYNDLNWQFAADDYLVVHRLATLPEYQGKGYAKNMMSFAENLSLKLRKRAIRLDTMCSNSANMYFYKSMGYHEVGIVNFDRIAADFMCFEKTIKPV